MSEEKKPGTTRLAFIIGGAGAGLIAFVVGKYAVYAPVGDLKDLVMLMAGGIMSALGAVVAYFYGKSK